MKAFPKPLTLEEEKIYLQKLKEGDLGAKNILVERNLRLVAHVIKKYQCPEEDLEDLLSIGTIGLIKAVTTFDSTKGNRLATYAARCIDNELLMMLRTKKKTSKEVSLFDPIGTDSEGNCISLLDVIECGDTDIFEIIYLDENMKRLQKVMQNTLNEREKEIICLRYGLISGVEVTQREIAKKLGISRSYVSRIEKKALSKLRDGFDKQ